MRSYLLSLLLIATPAFAHAGSAEISGHAELELRIFPYSPAFPEQKRSLVSPSVALQPEFRYRSDSRDDALTFIPFVRYDVHDDERTHGDLRALNWTHRGAGWDLMIGVGKVFWGVTESRHLVDIINQVDLVENLDEEQRLGQPMANLTVSTDIGSFGLFVLPGFRERTFADRNARLRPILPVVVDDARYESGAEQYHVDFAARWSATLGRMDIGLAHFHGTGREPRMLTEFRSGSPVFVPFYDQIDQSSVDAQMAVGNWLLKLEGMTRSGQGDRFYAAVGGFEYTITGIFGSSSDLGLLAEYHYDGRDDPALFTSFNRDIFVGARYVANDAPSTEILAGALVDRSNQTTFLNVEAQRRLGDNWKLDLQARFFVNVSPTDIPLYGVRQDDYFSLRISRFF